MASKAGDSQERDASVRRDAASTYLPVAERSVAKAAWMNRQDSLSRLEELQRLYEEMNRAKELRNLVTDGGDTQDGAPGMPKRAPASSAARDYRGR